MLKFAAPLAAMPLVLLPHLAAAQDRLDRMEAVSEEMFGMVIDAMIDEAVAEGASRDTLTAAKPDMSWGDEMRSAADCVLDRYDAEVGPEEVDGMLDRMEAVLPTIAEMPIEEWESLDDLQPAGMTQEQSFAINQECGMNDLIMEQMMTPEFMGAMMAAMN